MDELDKNKNYALYAFEAAYRVCFMASILAVTTIATQLASNVPPNYILSVGLISSVFLFFVTIPLGNSHLGADLRGILAWAMLFELVFFVSQSFDFLLYFYREIRLYFNYLDQGFLCLMIARCFWNVRSSTGIPVGFPKFDFIRPMVGGASSHKLLSNRLKLCGYGFMATSFLIGCLLHHMNAWFFVPATVTFIAIFVIYIVRNDEVRYLDMVD